MAIPAINVLGNPNVTEGNFQVAIEDLRKSVIGSGKAYNSVNTYSQYDTCIYSGIEYYSKINSNTGNTPAINANWGNVIDLINPIITNGTALGYGAGSGGAVTQATNKSTSVTLNKPIGQVTMNNAALAANASVRFQVNNNIVTNSDNIIVSIAGGSINAGIDYNCWATGFGGDMFFINLKNISGISLSEAVTINFTIIRGATA